MKIINFLLAVSILAVSLAYDYGNKEEEDKLTCPCGWANTKRIAGGKETAHNAYPWMVSLLDKKDNLHFCGGAIITEWHVISAAHCNIGYKPSRTLICVGAHRTKQCGLDGISMIYQVYTISNHRKYNRVEKANDISILTIDEKIVFGPKVGPVCFPKERITNELDGDILTVMGWEDTEEGTDLLQELDVTVVPYSECKKSYSMVEYYSTQICAYNPKGDTCKGDSGGPLVNIDPETNRYTLMGIVSYGDTNCRSFKKPSINTKVSAFYDWIFERIQNISNFFVKKKRGGKLCMKK